jgi:hypothetical protein
MTQENIIISINVEDEHEGDDFMILDYVNDFLSESKAEEEDLRTPHILDYTENYTVKELILICDYYGFSKEIKATKLGKDLLIHCLVDYELDPVNAVNVEKRRNMWFFINELKNDKFMKKFVLW